MVNAALYSSLEEAWETPDWLFERLDACFRFRLDACATADNAKCATFFTRSDDALGKDWSRYDRVWMNPPYGRTIGSWMEKAYQESRKGCVIVCLVPARTDTAWWHHWVEGKAHVHFVRGRLRFGRPGSGAVAASAPFPSALVIYGFDLAHILGRDLSPPSSRARRRARGCTGRRGGGRTRVRG